MNPYRSKSLIICFLALFSCANNLDFDQINDYSVTPTISASLAYFTILPSRFFDSTGNQSITVIEDESEIRVLDNSFFQEKLVKIDFYIAIKNEFDNDFSVQVDFLDDDRILMGSLNEIRVEAKELDFEYKETIEVSVNPNILNARILRVTLRIDNTATPLNSLNIDEFQFKSSVITYLDTDASN